MQEEAGTDRVGIGGDSRRPTLERYVMFLAALLSGGIIPAAHEFQVVGAVCDGPSNAVGIGHERHLQRALLLPFVLDGVPSVRNNTSLKSNFQRLGLF